MASAAMLARSGSHVSQTSAVRRSKKSRWWRIHFFSGMIKDIKSRAPFYVSDWTDAWDYRVVPATIYMYFAKYVYASFTRKPTTDLFVSILPALAFSLDMFDRTAKSFGVNEVLLASVLGSVVFSVFAVQPLVIVGVTGMSSNRYYQSRTVLTSPSSGPITVFSYTVYDIMVPTGTKFFPFMALIGL